MQTVVFTGPPNRLEKPIGGNLVVFEAGVERVVDESIAAVLRRSNERSEAKGQPALFRFLGEAPKRNEILREDKPSAAVESPSKRPRGRPKKKTDDEDRMVPVQMEAATCLSQL
jgi:hypothetical protein